MKIVLFTVWTENSFMVNSFLVAGVNGPWFGALNYFAQTSVCFHKLSDSFEDEIGTEKSNFPLTFSFFPSSPSHSCLRMSKWFSTYPKSQVKNVLSRIFYHDLQIRIELEKMSTEVLKSVHRYFCKPSAFLQNDEKCQEKQSEKLWRIFLLILIFANSFFQFGHASILASGFGASVHFWKGTRPTVNYSA